MRTPMPSPRGTNIEGLYLNHGGAEAAYDAAPANTALVKGVMRELATTMSAKEWGDLQHHLKGGTDGSRVTQAMDAVGRDSFQKMFPRAVLPKQAPYPVDRSKRW